MAKRRTCDLMEWKLHRTAATGRAASLPLPGTYLNVTGLENVKNWTVALNGEAKANVRAVVSGGSIMIVKKGLILSIR